MPGGGLFSPSVSSLNCKHRCVAGVLVCGPQLEATNGTPLQSFCTQYVTVCFNGWQFGWDFGTLGLFGLGFRPYTGCGFCARRLWVDMANRWLVKAVSFATYPCPERGS